MLNKKRIDHVLNTTVYSMTNTVPLIHLVRHRQLKFLDHILRSRKSLLEDMLCTFQPLAKGDLVDHVLHTLIMYKDCLGDNEGAMQGQQIAAFADDRRAWRNLVVACSAADGWWWWQSNVDYRFLLINNRHSTLEYFFQYNHFLHWNKRAYFKSESSKFFESIYFLNLQAERNNLMYFSCRSDVVENLTPLDLWMTFR